jgi:hypothetical protein
VSARAGHAAEKKRRSCLLLVEAARHTDMPDRAALITALILDRPTCLECIASKSLVSVERAGAVLETIATALVLNRATGRCVVCGEITDVHSVGRPT